MSTDDQATKPDARTEHAATSRVWMATRRAGLAFHAVEHRSTKCGRYIGTITQGAPEVGILPQRREAEAIKGVPCRKCYDTQASRRQPNVAPSKDRAPAGPRGRA